MRRLIFCFDGSWNKLDTRTHPTNVNLVAESVVPIDQHGISQIVYYDEGVGTSSGEWLRGGAFGKGLVENIREAYRFLIFNYAAGDEVFVFGFSRGAFTARSFIGFVRSVGVIGVNDARQIDEAWALYRKHARRADTDPDELLAFRAKFCPGLCVDDAEVGWRRARSIGNGTEPQRLRIKYCGVWNTVGSLGWKAVVATFDRRPDRPYRHHDTDLSAMVEAGRHALALDERRVHFMPTLWRNVHELNRLAGKPDDDRQAPYQQKWFPGDHGSVGGGGSERGLSNAALHWVLRGAIDKGLQIRLEGRSQLRTIRYTVSAPLRNTPAGGGLFSRTTGFAKQVLLTADRSGLDEIADVHPAALRRWFADPAALPEKRAYRPAMLARFSDAIEMQRAIYHPLETKAEARTYVVEPGDSLRGIAHRQFGSAAEWETIFALNRDLLDDENDIFPGDTLRLPPNNSSGDISV